MVNNSTRRLDWFVLVLAIVLSVGSIALFAWEGRPAFVTLHLSERTALAWDALLSLLFFLQHSGMVRRSFRARLSVLVPPRYDAAVYAIASGAVLTLVVVFWQPTTTRLLVLDGAARWAATICSLLAVAAFVYTLKVLLPFDPLGISAIWWNLRNAPPRPSSFVARGPYLWVRHPIYSCILVFFWSPAVLTSDRLLLNILWSAWIWVGATLEERDLVVEFGDAYKHYQQKVPMLIPWRGRVRADVNSSLPQLQPRP